MKYFLVVLIAVCSHLAQAQSVQFKCDIFGGFETSATGSLLLLGDDPTSMKFELAIAEGDRTPRHFDGNAYLAGSVKFTDLPMPAQSAITRAMNHSRRPAGKTGDLLLFTNTKNQAESTLNIFLMPSGEIGYLEIGALNTLCM